MAWVCLVLLGGWIAAAVVARREYVENLQDSIHQHRLDAERASRRCSSGRRPRCSPRRLGGETHEIVYALSLFEMAHDRAMHPAVRGAAQASGRPRCGGARSRCCRARTT